MNDDPYCEVVQVGPQSYLCGLCGVLYHNIEALPFRAECRSKMPVKPMPPNPPAEGAGTELKKLLAEWGITDATGCGCERHANEMNARGEAWCRDNVELIVSWLENAANDRGWLGKPSSFAAKAKRRGFRWIARKLVRVAIKRAEAKDR